MTFLNDARWLCATASLAMACSTAVAPGLHTDSLRAAEACAAAGSGPFPVVKAAPVCGKLFVEEGCRHAFDTVAQVAPELKQAAVVGACRTAYCEVLQDPKPALCSEVPATPEARAALWVPFVRQVEARDHGGHADRVREITGDWARKVGDYTVIDSSRP